MHVWMDGGVGGLKSDPSVLVGEVKRKMCLLCAVVIVVRTVVTAARLVAAGIAVDDAPARGSRREPGECCRDGKQRQHMDFFFCFFINNKSNPVQPGHIYY